MLDEMLFKQTVAATAPLQTGPWSRKPVQKRWAELRNDGHHVLRFQYVKEGVYSHLKVLQINGYGIRIHVDPVYFGT